MQRIHLYSPPLHLHFYTLYPCFFFSLGVFQSAWNACTLFSSSTPETTLGHLFFLSYFVGFSLHYRSSLSKKRGRQPLPVPSTLGVMCLVPGPVTWGLPILSVVLNVLNKGLETKGKLPKPMASNSWLSTSPFFQNSHHKAIFLCIQCWQDQTLKTRQPSDPRHSIYGISGMNSSSFQGRMHLSLLFPGFCSPKRKKKKKAHVSRAVLQTASHFCCLAFCSYHGWPTGCKSCLVFCNKGKNRMICVDFWSSCIIIDPGEGGGERVPRICCSPLLGKAAWASSQ